MRPRDTLSGGKTAPSLFRRRTVEHFIDELGADEAVLNFEIEPGEAFRRLIGHQQRGEKGEEGAGVGMCDGDAPAAVEDHDRDREAAEEIGERTRDRHARRHAIRRLLDMGDGGTHALAHERLRD